MINWKERKLRKQNEKLKARLHSCINLLDEVAQLDTSLYSAAMEDKALRRRFVVVVSRAKKVLDE